MAHLNTQSTIDMDSLPFIVKKEGSFLEFYPRGTLNTSNEEPACRLYLWDRDEVERLYQMTKNNENELKIIQENLLGRIFNSLFGFIYRKLLN